jgi:hypothetical protein
MKQLIRLALILPVFYLAACVNLTKPRAVEECANDKPSTCTNRKDSGVTKDTSTTPPDTTDVPPTPDSGVPDTQTADTKVPVGPDTAGDTIVTPKPDTQSGPETAVTDPKPEATVEPPLVVVEPSTPDASVPIDTNPPVDTMKPDTLVPVDTTPPTPDTKTTGSENCPVVIVKSGGATVGQSGLGAYCVVTCDDLATSYFGWGCSNFTGRTVKVNGVELACGKTPMPAKVNGYYVFEISAGTNSSSSIFWYNQTSKETCPLPTGGLLP